MNFVGIDLKVIAWDGGGSCAVAEDWLEVPPAVDATNVERYIFGRFGDPCDVAVTSSDEFGDLVMGWVFPTDALEVLDLPTDGLELMVVPYVRFRDGSRRELFEYEAELDREFTSLVGDLEPDTVGRCEPPPNETTARLEHEHPSLWSAEPELVQEQLRGWLQRMLHEGWTYLILEMVENGRYLQFLTHEGDWLRGEVVGERYLSDHQQLGPDELAVLDDIGWHAPGRLGDPSGNHWLEWGTPADELHDERDRRPTSGHDPGALGADDIDEAARVGAAALLDVFGLQRPDQLGVSTGHASHAED